MYNAQGNYKSIVFSNILPPYSSCLDKPQSLLIFPHLKVCQVEELKMSNAKNCDDLCHTGGKQI